MGLSVMENAPGFDQMLKFGNEVNRMQYVSPGSWAGEGTLGAFGLADASNAPDIINAIGQNAPGIINAFRGNKKSKGGHPAAQQHPVIPGSPPPTGDGSQFTKYVIYGGIALAISLVIYTVMKKKKKSGDHAEGM